MQESGVIQFVDWYLDTLGASLADRTSSRRSGEMAAAPAALDDLTIWTDAEPLECCAVVPEAPDVATISFVAPDGGWFRFLPGQFIAELPVPGGPIWRTYTISSSPSRPCRPRLTVKAGPNSIGTRWMLDHPEGRHEDPAPAAPRASSRSRRAATTSTCSSRLGTGIAPALSMTNYLYDRGLGTDVVLIIRPAVPGEIICRKRLEPMVTRVPSIKLPFIVERRTPTRSGPATAAG